MPNMPYMQDVTGLGRLADTQQRIATNRRADMGALQNREMNKITLANARQEMLQRESDNVWRQGLTQHMQQMPQGSNPYLHQRDFAMKTGRMDFVGKLDDQQFERIGDLMAIDPDTAIEVANNTIGVSQGLQFANTPDEGQWSNMYTATDPVSGDLVRMGQKPSGEWGVAPGRPEEKKPLVQFDMGKTPPGYQLIEENGQPKLVPIPGGPVERELTAQEKKSEGRKIQTSRAGGTVIQDLQRGLDIVQSNPLASGWTSIVTEVWPESDAAALEGMTQSALSNVGLDTLQQMRENSPTGGALGQVPIQQQKRLEQVLGSLQKSQRKEIVEENLKRVINIYKDIVYGTPEQQQGLLNEGTVDRKYVEKYSERYDLSFDELGNKIKGDLSGLSDEELIKGY